MFIQEINMLSFIAVAFWSVLFSYVIYRIIRNQAVSMTWAEVILAYGIKVILGCLYGYIFMHYYGGSDTWVLHANSIAEKQMLLNDPLQFFWEFTPGTAIKNGSGIIDIAGFYIRDLEYCVQAKTLGIFNLISNGNYYVNVVFWNLLLFWGHYWLFKLLTQQFPSKRKFYFVIVYLFLPAVFWLSGIRSDGLMFFSLSLLLLYFYKWLSTPRLSFLFYWIVGFIGVVIIRPPVAALLIPALISWWLCMRFAKRSLLCFSIVYFLAGMIFFGSTALSSSGFPGMVAQRQQEFMDLKGSAFQLDTLQPTLKSFISVLPQATANTFLRPHIFEARGALQVMAASEVIFFWLVFLFFLFKHDQRWQIIITKPFVLALLFFSVSLYLFIGYTIPFPGAIVRYKIIPELFLLAAFASCLHTRFAKNELG